MTPHKIAELQRLREAAVARAGTTREYAIWLEALDKASGDLLTLASRALPAATDVPVTGTSIRLMEQAQQTSDAYFNSILDRAKREAYAECKAIADTDADERAGSLQEQAGHRIAKAIEALAEKKP
ncbi:MULTISPECIES: hypothetical protein [unclassified Chelatococcus]|uniref:hypothetical protein n=1 Tax=unclassified Chelatococcus TaxID=2638111 RepID=UPI001BCEE01A|nr:MULTISPECIES: hypothetical protein [unclassified Chelatococcus]CAH1665470.1 hypothetical protein CHELA41_22669 [Hyphomicrobiales bacterium]MBS7737725.1 hypothetical protein [Chelatococcus sp. HY11]MBX3544141.1 hypothetical protein [Chelatococcus sp.]MCO5077147.1 hypothetical protein [Chelatococcus sp.]CAH1681317.1 hypothetical protein CHELA20_52250 [Hyphomicrobiales bacterium]